jgi:hypothetical protein
MAYKIVTDVLKFEEHSPVKIHASQPSMEIGIQTMEMETEHDEMVQVEMVQAEEIRQIHILVEMVFKSHEKIVSPVLKTVKDVF